MSDEHVPGYAPAPIRARVLQVALILNILGSAAYHLVVQPGVVALYGGHYSGDPPGIDPIVHGLFSLFVVLVSLVVIANVLLTPLAFFAWVHRASRNAHAISPRPLEHSPAMAIGWWFVPFANLWQPLQVVREIETASDPEETLVSSSDTSWWWGGYLLGNFVAFFSNETLRPNVAHVAMGAIAVVAHGVSAFMLIRIVERIGKNQAQSAKRRRWAEVFEDDEPEHG